MTENIISIKYPFAIDRHKGTLLEETNFSQHVRQMMIQLLMTSPGERINRPDFGCGIKRMVFTPNSDAMANMTQVTVLQSLEKWLGTVIEVNDVKVKALNEKLEITIVYLIRANQKRQYLNLEVVA